MSSLFKALGTACWIGLLCIGFSFAWRYEATPGTPAKAPSDWPEDSRIKLDAERPTIVVFAHPECPCTRVALSNLQRAVGERPDRALIQILIVQLAGIGKVDKESQTWTLAEDVPGAIVMPDPQGRETRRFGARTSGQVLAYSPAGTMLFSGGVTVARGHEGSSSGRAAIEAILSNGSTGIRSAPVYGCSLLGAEETTR